MDQQQSFSHGLLYSISPDNISHVHEDTKVDNFDWQAYEDQYAGDSAAHIILSFMKITAVKWGLSKSE
jgi:hypothetical protein